MTFDEQLKQAMEDSILKFVRSGEWCKLDYGARVTLDASCLRKVQSSIDMDSVLARVKIHVEEHMANSIFNSMATEIATDVKKIMSNTELREDIRSIIREKIRMAAAGLEKP